MASEGEYFCPGETVPDPGIYKCTKCSHTKFFSNDIKGFSFPQDHYSLAKWELIKKTSTPKVRSIKRRERAMRETFLASVLLKSLPLLGRTRHPA